MITKPRSDPKKSRYIPRPPRKFRRRRCCLTTCNQLYTPVRANQKFCSTEHKNEFNFKTESFQRVKREVMKLVEEETFRHVDRIARVVFLLLETTPPPALVDRVAHRLADMIRTGTLLPPVGVLSETTGG